MGRCDIWLVLVLIGWAGVDMSVCLPSLWLYIRSLGGSKACYGLAGALASGAQFVSSPFFGWLADRYSDRTVIAASLLVQLLGGLLYACAVAFPHPAGGSGSGSTAAAAEPPPLLLDEASDAATTPMAAYMVVMARGILGFAAGNGASCRAYLARNSPPSQRTTNLGLAAAAWRIGLVVGPAINWLLVRLPTRLALPAWLRGLHFSSLTWVGWFIAISSALCFVLVLTTLRHNNPASTITAAGEAVAKGAGPRVWVRQLWVSRAWVMQFIGMVNNFAISVLQFAIPLYCLEHYDFDQVQTANVFSVYGAVAAVTALSSAKLSPRFWERTILLHGELMQTVCIGACVLFWGGCSIGSWAPAPLPVWGTFLLAAFQSMGQAWQVPGLQGCYLYQCGSQNQGMFQALFMSATALGRCSGAYWVGFASGHLGDCVSGTAPPFNSPSPTLWLGKSSKQASAIVPCV